MTQAHKGIVFALLAAALFGASTPFSKALVGQLHPVALAGMLYLGSGVGLAICFIVREVFKRHEQTRPAALTAPDLPWLFGAIACGGVAGPILLMIGLTLTPSSSASLLLNIEGVLTALLAWFVFRENFDRRVLVGMLLIVVAGGLLSWEQAPASDVPWGALAIVGACLCWAIDNNLTRRISASDPLQIAAIKGLAAGSVNAAIALGMGIGLPGVADALGAMAVGFFGYGVSLVMFVLALRHLGTARTGAYFSVAPFVGALISLPMQGDAPGLVFWLAAALMAAGLWLHLIETHVHEHEHPLVEHRHEHHHDSHHLHAHGFEWDGKEPHVHTHLHRPLRHAHPHYPDIHHRHDHQH